MTLPLLSVNGLTVRIRGKRILSDVSFDLRQGEILGLFGDSGSGKTTILHAISGLHPQSYEVEGKILLDGESLSNDPPEARSHKGIGIVLQDLGLFDDRSVFDNVAYPLHRRRWDKARISAAVEEILSFLHIGDLARRNPRQISGGQRQRVALARVLIYQPRVLLLDEPLRGLQEELQLQFLAFIRAVEKRGTAVVFVTHERRELELVSHTIIRIDGGRLISRERNVGGERFGTLASVILIPDAEVPGRHYRATHVRLLVPDEIPEKEETEARVVVREWRPLNDGRFGALVEFSSGEPGWLIFGSVGDQYRDLPLSNVRIAFKKIHEEKEA